jgi:hypothetical protein
MAGGDAALATIAPMETATQIAAASVLWICRKISMLQEAAEARLTNAASPVSTGGGGGGPTHVVVSLGRV